MLVAHDLGRFPEFSPTSHYENVGVYYVDHPLFSVSLFESQTVLLQWVSRNCDMVELCFFVSRFGIPLWINSDELGLVNSLPHQPLPSLIVRACTRISAVNQSLWHVFLDLRKFEINDYPFPFSIKCICRKVWGLLKDCVLIEKASFFLRHAQRQIQGS